MQIWEKIESYCKENVLFNTGNPHVWKVKSISFYTAGKVLLIKFMNPGHAIKSLIICWLTYIW